MAPRALLAALLAVCCALLLPPREAVAGASTANRIETLSASRSGARVLLRIKFRSPLAVLPRGFSVATPARVVLDLPASVNGLGRIEQPVGVGPLRSVRVVDGEGALRTRLVLNLDRPLSFEASLEGQTLVVALWPAAPPADQAPVARARPAAGAEPTVDLLEAWHRALVFDPGLRGAAYERDSGASLREMARAGMLPNLAFNAVKSRYLVDQTSDITSTTQTLNYNSSQFGISLRQPIYNADALARLRQARQQDVEGGLNYAGRRNELAGKLVSAYFNVLLGQQSIELAEAQVAAYTEQGNVARRRQQGGEGTRTEIAEAQSRLALAQAELSTARDQRAVAEQVLANLTGLGAVRLAALPVDFRVGDPVERDLGAWLAQVRARNPDLRARAATVEVARAGVAVASAGYYPRLDLMAGASRATSDTLSLVFQTYNYRMIGLQLSVPLFSGGYVSGAVDQARLRLEKARADLAVATDAVLLEARKNYLAAIHGAERVRSYQSAVSAGEVALEGARVGLKYGTHTNVDVLNAQRQVFTARRDLALASYNYLTAWFQVKALANDVDEGDVAALSALLRP